jgi:putative addiction module CopG family antidote
MKLTLPDSTQKMIEDRVRSGQYKSREDVISAAVAQLAQSEALGDFEPGEMDELLAAGERSGEPLDGEKVLEELRDLRAKSGKN